MRALFIVVLVLAAGAGGLQLVRAPHSDAAGSPAQAAPAAAAPGAPVGVTIVAAADDEDAAAGDDEGDEEDEQVIPLADIPAVVLEAAKQAVPGLVPDSAELDRSSGETVYDVHGLVDGQTWEVEVSAAGLVLGSELDDD
jgi:uncharacterized membrane protein YkoI